MTANTTAVVITNRENDTIVYVNTNDTIVYVNTDVNFKHGYTYRYANSTKDFVGYRSHQVKTLKELVDNVMSMLKLTLEEADERQLL